jgi:DNA modification methylase
MVWDSYRRGAHPPGAGVGVVDGSGRLMLTLPEWSVTTLDRVHCMSALALLRALPSGSVDVVLTDIPYGEINHVDRLHERAKYKNGPIRQLHKGGADPVNFDLRSILIEIERITRGFIYIFCGTAQTGAIRDFFTNQYMTRQCIWEKTNPSPLHGQYIWLSSIENCICIRKPNSPFNEFCQSAVWRFAIERDQIHPTQKPRLLMEYIILSSSNPGDLILDPFIGSGTTAVAARNLGRHYIGCDISPEYVAIARKRLAQPFTLPMFETVAAKE